MSEEPKHTVRPQESLVLYKSFNTLWGDVWAYRDATIKLQGHVEKYRQGTRIRQENTLYFLRWIDFNPPPTQP